MKYYVDGYTPPFDIKDAAGVKQLQSILGVKVDGIWGKKSQAAFDSKMGSGMASGTGNAVFDNYYSKILSQLNVPKVEVTLPSEESLKKQYEAILRPSVDQAIQKRYETVATNKAELDADAAARGMGASTFVSSMKSREQGKADNDVAQMESAYTMALAERIFDAMKNASANKLEADQANAQMLMDAQKTAFGYAMQWYAQWLEFQQKSSGGSKKSSKKKASLPVDEIDAYVRLLSPAERKELYTSSATQWKGIRQEIVDSIGKTGLKALEKKYGAR